MLFIHVHAGALVFRLYMYVTSYLSELHVLYMYIQTSILKLHVHACTYMYVVLSVAYTCVCLLSGTDM